MLRDFVERRDVTMSAERPDDRGARRARVVATIDDRAGLERHARRRIRRGSINVVGDGSACVLLGVTSFVVLTAGILGKKPFGKVHRALGASFAGCLHLQVLLGISLVAMGRYFPQLIGHIVMMAVAAQVTQSMNRRRETPNLVLPLIGVLIALVCITGGVMAIGRGLFTVSAF